MSVSEKNKHQWSGDEANLSTQITHNIWDKQPGCLDTPNFRKIEASNVVSDTKVDFPTGKPNPESTGKLSNSNTISDNRIDNIPALTPMAFGSGQDAHLSKQEENRRQWKAALDEQLKEQQLMRGKNLQELQKECEFNKIQSGSSSNNCGHCDNSNEFHGLSISNNPSNSALASHPSASHFMSSGFFLPDSTVTNDFHASSRKMDTPNQPWKVGFNRVRGFTQQLYIDSLESAERARLAHETRAKNRFLTYEWTTGLTSSWESLKNKLINLKQIEEKRRLKEEEKARLLMEEKMEEERISRERLRLQQMAEVENARKIAKDMEEFQRTQYLYESLVRAQEEAKLTKIQKHPCYSELKRNRDSLSQKAVIQSELLVPYLSVASEVEKQSQNNPLYAFLSSSGCNAPDSVAYPKNSLAVQTSFPENIGIQTENFEWTNSKDKQVSNNPDSKNQNNGTPAHKLKPSDNKSVKNNLSKMSVSVSNQQKQQSYSISSTSMPKHQVSTINTESLNNTTFLNHENPYGPADLIRTYDVLIPNDANIILPVSHEPGVVETFISDSLRNSNTKHERSITRQDTILQQLSEIRKGLQLRQMLCESSTYEDDINY
uniref:CCDC66 domain-containing protein n=1 Tax=Schistosoma haematobium TaxID=6185 RepID=A0A095AYU6_SCHHA